MRSSLLIKNESKIKKSFLINENPEYVLKQLLGIDGDVKVVRNDNKYLLYNNGKLLYNFNVSYQDGYELYDYVINVFDENSSYHYFCDDNHEGMKANLREYCFEENNTNYRIVNSYYFCVDITKGNKGLAIEIEDQNIDIKFLESIIKKISLEDTLKDMYNKLSVITNCSNIKIKKYIKLNTCDFREKITDLLVIRNNELLEYLTNVTILVNNKERKFTFSKNNNNYSITFVDGSVDDFTSSYFLANEQVEFIRKIDTKKKALSKR